LAVYYILLIGLTAAGIPLCKKSGFSKRRIAYLALVFAVMFAFAAFRRTTGYDYNLYATWYNQLIAADDAWITAWSREKGFAVLFKTFTLITADWQVMFAVISFIIAAGVTVYIGKYSECAFISVAAFISLGLYYNSMNFMRQFIAAVIASFALSYIDSRQPLRYFVLILFASCFHYSALLMIPFYFILMIRMNWIVLGAYCAAGAASFAFSKPIIGFVTRYFYKDYNVMTSPHVYMGLSPRYTVIFGILFVVFFLFREELIKKRSLNSVLINAYFFAVYFEFIGIKHSIIARFSLLFLIAPILALTPDVIMTVHQKIMSRLGSRKIHAVLAAAAFCVYGLTVNTVLLLNNYNGVIPYRTIWSDIT